MGVEESNSLGFKNATTELARHAHGAVDQDDSQIIDQDDSQIEVTLQIGMIRMGRQSPATCRRVWIWVLVGLGVLALAGCAGGQPEPISKQGEGAQNIYMLIFWTSVAVFVIVETAILWCAIKYRKRKDDDGSLPVQYLGNNKIELIWTIIPLIIVTVIFVFSFRELTQLQAIAEEPDLELDIEGFQWQWRFSYPDEAVEVVGTLGQEPPTMVVPVNRTINISLRSEDVIHSFYIPQTLYKLDAIPGQTNEYSIEFTKTGRFTGQCAELCGLSHSQMTFWVEVVEEDAFDDFIAVAQLDKQVGQLAGAECVPAGQELKVAIDENGAMTPTCLAVPPNVTFDVQIRNDEQGVQHNIAIYETPRAFTRGEAPLFDGALFPGVGTEAYQVDGLKPGQYFFVDTEHPRNNGTLNVGDPGSG